METEEVDWDDLVEPDDEDEDNNGSFVFDTGRRSSVEIDNMSANAHDNQDPNAGVSIWNQTHDQSGSKRLRSRKPRVASISEGDDEETATVDGEDEQMADAR